jgi:glycosyltransferase involved in cell wall biosynthesis
VKDEEKVVGRLLKALLKLNYPWQKMKIIIVEDGSVDKTAGNMSSAFAEVYESGRIAVYESGRIAVYESGRIAVYESGRIAVYTYKSIVSHNASDSKDLKSIKS